MNLFVPQAMGWMISLMFFYKNGFGVKQPIKLDVPLNNVTEQLSKKNQIYGNQNNKTSCIQFIFILLNFWKNISSN